MKYIHSLQSEWIKTKNSAVMWLTVGGALFVPVLITISRLVQHNQTLLANSSEGVWLKLFKQNWQFMSFFFVANGHYFGEQLACPNRIPKQYLETIIDHTTKNFDHILGKIHNIFYSYCAVFSLVQCGRISFCGHSCPCLC